MASRVASVIRASSALSVRGPPPYMTEISIKIMGAAATTDTPAGPAHDRHRRGSCLGIGGRSGGSSATTSGPSIGLASTTRATVLPDWADGYPRRRQRRLRLRHRVLPEVEDRRSQDCVRACL